MKGGEDQWQQRKPRQRRRKKQQKRNNRRKRAVNTVEEHLSHYHEAGLRGFVFKQAPPRKIGFLIFPDKPGGWCIFVADYE
jgi:hypothetical protein